MNKQVLTEKIKSHLQVLCSEIGERRVGSEENRKATVYVEKVLEECGWKIETTKLSVIDWTTEGATLNCNGKSFEVFSSHYSLGCSVEGELLAINTVNKLEKADIKDKIVLLYGEIASQQIAPKRFPFWNPEEHQRLIFLLEKGNPKAIISATERNSAIAGGVYPFPLFEDGDFDIPSVYMKDTEGEKLLACTGQMVKLVSKAKRIPETAFNVIGRNSGQTKNRITITAHIDTKINTPGAIDNGTGVVTNSGLVTVVVEAETFMNFGTAIERGTPLLWLQISKSCLGLSRVCEVYCIYIMYMDCSLIFCCICLF